MSRKPILVMILTIFLLGLLGVTFKVQKVEASGTIYIHADGSIEPPTAPIQRDGDIYTFTGDINDSVVIERDNIVVDGVGYILQGTGSMAGIDITGRSNVTIKNIQIKTFEFGIRLWQSSNNTISLNNITNNNYGILLGLSHNNTLSSNLMNSNIINFGVYGSELHHFFHSVDTSNLVDDKPVYYWVNQHGVEIPSDAGYVALVNCTEITVKDLTLTNNREGLLLANTQNSYITNNTLANNGYGIVLWQSSSNSISGNSITTNNWYGISLEQSSSNSIFGNSITTNNLHGIWLEFSSNYNSISGNNIVNNFIGIFLTEPSNNSIYHNNFIYNFGHVDIPFSGYNISYASWDDGYPSGGNYWNDYVGVDVKSGLNQDLPESDGIGDTPYIIDADNQDRYPLMRPWTLMPTVYTFSIVWEEETFTVSVESNSTVSNFAFNQPNKEISFYVTGPDGTIGFCNVTIPKQLLYGEPWSVLIDGISVTPTTAENETHSILYFTYTHSTHKIQIIGTYVIAPPPPPLSVSISPLSTSILVGQSVTFTSTVSGGYTPYSYQWYLNGAPVSGATSASWTFTPTSSGIYYIHPKVTDAKGNAAQSDTARITVTAVPVGGYSIPIQVATKTEPIIPYIALIATLTAILTKLRPKTKRKR